MPKASQGKGSSVELPREIGSYRTGRKRKRKTKALSDHDRWMTEEDLRTLRRAREIRGDKERLARARDMADDEMEALRGVREGR